MTVSREFVERSFHCINEFLIQNIGLLPIWVLKFDRNKRAAGRCFHNRKKISISLDYLESHNITEADVYDTLLHEFAHVIAGPAAGHGPIWANVAKALGCSAQVHCKQFIHECDYKYVIMCPNGCKKYRHRMVLDAHKVCRHHQEKQLIYDTKTKNIIY